VTLTLTSDDLESHIIVNALSTLRNSTIWFVVHCVWLWTYGHAYGCTYRRMDVRTDIFTGFIRPSRRRWPKNPAWEILGIVVEYQKPLNFFDRLKHGGGDRFW